MPGFDRRGPDGMGPMTGGGRGACRTGVTGGRQFMGRGTGHGQGRGRGFGRDGFRGAGRGLFEAPPAYAHTEPEVGASIDGLKAEAVFLRNQLEAVTRQISEFEKKSSDSES